MALPSSGAISLSQVNVELGLSASATINMGSAAVRGLFEVPSGAISMSDGYGKADAFAFAIASNQTNANLRTLAVNAGWDESEAVRATINSGVVISGDVQANSTAALTVDGSWPGGVTLINNGTIVGRGGNGGMGGEGRPFFASNGFAGSAAGRALRVIVPLTLNNNGVIAGGGGGGGGGAGVQVSGAGAPGGGGGGGRSSNINSLGGPGGIGAFGTVGDDGANGTISAAGSGGAGLNGGGAGGNGGDYGTAGSAGVDGPAGGRFGGAGGAAGEAISGNSNITYTATGTRLGPIV